MSTRSHHLTQPPWKYRHFLKDKLQCRERYFRPIASSATSILHTTAETLYVITDAKCWRTYLTLFEDLPRHFESILEPSLKLRLVLLESVAENMDYCSISGYAEKTESPSVNERGRIIKLAKRYSLEDENRACALVPLCDVTCQIDNRDFQLDESLCSGMSVVDRTRFCVLQAGRIFSTRCINKDRVIILSGEEELCSIIQMEENDHIGTSVDIRSSIHLLSEHYPIVFSIAYWTDIIESCEEEYTKRNASKVETKISSGHFEYWSDQFISTGIREGRLFTGKLEVSKACPKEGYVTIRALKGISTKYFLNESNGHFNRALHGDTVFIEPLDSEFWDVPICQKKLMYDGDVTTHGRQNSRQIIIEGTVQTIPTARVVAIHQSSFPRREYIATLASENNQTGKFTLVIPMDIRLPKVRLRSRLQYEQLENQRLVVAIDKWELGSAYPVGHIVKAVGPVGDLETEISCILKEQAIDILPRSASALACLPSVSTTEVWKVPIEEIQKRRDLRQSCRVFSVDPIGCQDIDDAMHAKYLSNGDLEVGVHIADVTYFLQQGSALDRDASQRSTTIYLTDRRFDMLPTLLSADLCSLHAGCDRLAVSVIWTISPDFATVRDYWCGRSIIRSIQAMTYEQADKILCDEDPNDRNSVVAPLTAGHPVEKKNIKDLKHDLTVLSLFSRKLRKDRETQGAIDLSSGDRGSELAFTIDENGCPVKILNKKHLEVHDTIAELMILANSYAATRIYNRFPNSALVRVHPSIQSEKTSELRDLLRVSGFSFAGESNAALAHTLRDVKEGSGLVHALVSAVMTRAMSEAKYICAGQRSSMDISLSHYGLGIGYYTHFTSPIRRYADVIVHRQLLASLDEERVVRDVSLRNYQSMNLPKSEAFSVLDWAQDFDLEVDNLEDADFMLDSLISGATESLLISDQSDKQDDFIEKSSEEPYSSTYVATLCEHLNNQNRAAKLASMECQGLFLSLFFKANIDRAQAIVVDLKVNGCIVYVPKYDIKGIVFVCDRDGVVHMNPSIFGAPSTSGLPPSPGFSCLDGCRSYPDGTCTLYEGINGEGHSLHLNVPGFSKGVVLKPLDVVIVQLSCDFSDNIARIPRPRFHLVSLGPSFLHSAATKQMHLSTDDATSTPNPGSWSSRRDLPNFSMYSVLNSFPVYPILEKALFRFEYSSTACYDSSRLQKFPGRLSFCHFGQHEMPNNEEEKSVKTSSKPERPLDEYDVSRRLEREATARIHKVLSEKHNARKAKAAARK